MAHKVDASRFTMQPSADIPRSAFDVQHTHKTTFNAGFLVPVYVDEVLPGDSFRLKMTAFARLSTPLVPLMDNMFFESFFFFVPNRLLWSNWERFMGEQLTPSDTTVFLVPQVVLGDANISAATIFDYFGLTVNNEPTASLSVTALPFRAYNLIFNEWFRDQDLVTPATVLVDDGPDPVATYTMKQRAKRHDYFTSARPWPQKPMNISDLSNNAMGPQAPGGRYLNPTSGVPVTGIGIESVQTPTVGTYTVRESGRSNTVAYSPSWISSDDAFFMRVGPGDSPDLRVLVNDIRTAVMIQGFLERNARGGTRYTEIVMNQFRVQSPDARLQRPEYLGGGRSMVSINPIAQTSGTSTTGESTTVLGEQAGIGSVVAQHGFSQSFTEHGYIIGLVNCRPEILYQQGVNRMWSRRTQFDFYWPALAHLGEQAITQREIFADGTANDNLVFGYQERWSEYKYKPSRTSGYFRSTDATPLDIWHLGENFSPAPVLNNVFVTQGFDEVDRVLQSSTNFGQQFLLDTLFDVRMVRCMPMYSIPGIGGRL